MDTIFTLGLNNDEEAGSENIKLNLDDLYERKKQYDLNTLSNKKNYIHTIVDDIINYIQDTQLLINKPKIISQIKNPPR